MHPRPQLPVYPRSNSLSKYIPTYSGALRVSDLVMAIWSYAHHLLVQLIDHLLASRRRAAGGCCLRHAHPFVVACHPLLPWWGSRSARSPWDPSWRRDGCTACRRKGMTNTSGESSGEHGPTGYALKLNNTYMYTQYCGFKH